MNSRICASFAAAFAIAATLSSAIAVADEQASSGRPVSYNQDIRPILSNNCFQCHGPGVEDRQADMRLDIPDEADLDEVVARVSATDPDVLMPPPDSNKKLTPKQIQLITRWIAQGGEYQKHWAFLPPRKHELPQSTVTGASDHAIDRLVVARLHQEGLTRTARAEKRTLLRRVTIDITGLPPTVEEIHAFLEDSSPNAWQTVVDRLLTSPHYGEHMARYWLDLVRFADTNGLHHDHYREMTPYRDWVIRAFNDNLPFNEFVVDQIAGDLFDKPTIDQQIASGFNRLHLIIDRGTALPEESFTRNVVDRVSSVGTAFLGLTLECAVCHDHKYDPISQRDFYQLYAFFNNFDGGPETGGRRGLDFKRGLQPPYLELPSPEQRSQLDKMDQSITALTRQIKTLDAKPESSQQKKTLTDQLAAQQKARDAIITEIPATLVMKERAEVRPTHILVRGNYDQPGEAVERNTPDFLPPMKHGDGPATRMNLAEWLVDSSNPLTARVAVNRFWQQIFGVGLVRTSEDFGAQGEPPSHPELLDQLTIRFVESGWDVKSLLRYIVLSETYQLSSRAPGDPYIADPDNRLLARGSRYRWDAEVIRDQVLSFAGLLNSTLYGKSVKPPQPEGLWKIVAMPSSYPRIYVADTGDKIYRRSVYSFWKRGLPPPQMTIFDAPSRESCTARRERTNTPLQALVLMNEQQYFAAAMTLANTLLQNAELTDQQRIHSAYETITAQVPDEPTLSTLTLALQQFRRVYSDDPESAKQMIAATALTELKAVGDVDQEIELAAMTMLVHSLLNMDATRTRE
jgi:mono/diheme cytochrome c family protein